jgi:hypothetical protein
MKLQTERQSSLQGSKWIGQAEGARRMYYRVAIQVDPSAHWQWKSTVLSSLSTLFHFLRLFGALSHDRLRVFSSSERVGLTEQLKQENEGRASTSVTAAHFLQQHMLCTTDGGRNIPEREGETDLQRRAIAVLSPPAGNERGGDGSVLQSGGMSALKRRREELESGSGGDHDRPYRFSLPPSSPQVLAWMTLLVRVQRGELHP